LQETFVGIPVSQMNFFTGTDLAQQLAHIHSSVKLKVQQLKESFVGTLVSQMNSCIGTDLVLIIVLLH